MEGSELYNYMKKYFYYAEVNKNRVSGLIIEKEDVDGQVIYESLIKQLEEKFKGEPSIKAFNLI